ncbi:MAG TPA: hypothetical protein VJH06_01135 [Candidatus Paceibacterota bacterium]
MQHSTYFPDSFYRVVVKGLCVRDGKILFIKEGEGLSENINIPKNTVINIEHEFTQKEEELEFQIKWKKK